VAPVGIGGSQLRRPLAALAVALGAASAAVAGPAPLDPVVIDASAPVASFVPIRALGAALDGAQKGDTDNTLTPFNIERMRSSGVRAITYRTRPELGIEAWHWTDHGTWSDAARSQGYWTGDDNPAGPPPRLTWGYSLPRRGDTIDNANNTGYSRLDDGDPASFWKSNPYLDRRYTGLAQNRPEWIVLSFTALTRFDAARILWADPFARHFLVQYWDGADDFEDGKQTSDSAGEWHTFPHGDVTVSGRPADDSVLRLADEPIASHFVRILLLQSSETGPPGSTDIRDRLGYAVREVSLGVLGPGGALVDAVRHGKTKDDQTYVQVSSTDPWHRAIDRDPDTEQPGLDFVFASRLAGEQPAMAPVGVVFDTPENAAAELRYIRRRGWPVSQVELGEEPDGQYMRPEDYAELYLEAAHALRAVDPAVRLGGPSMEGPLTGTWPDETEGLSWMGRFVAELKARGALGQFQFFSFEDYVFEDVCRPPGGLLRLETRELAKTMAELASEGVPTDIPWVISEYGFSPFAGRQMSDMPSALLSADIVGNFLTLGGSAAYLFGYPPDQPANQKFPCAGFGNMMFYEADDDGRSRWPMPTWFAERMMLDDWGGPSDLSHRLYAAHATLYDDRGLPFVTAYPLRAPDGRWSVMLVNRDQSRAHLVPVAFRTAAGETPLGAGGEVGVVQYSPAQYAWVSRGEHSHPSKDLPPARFQLPGGRALRLPAMSLTVVSGSGPAP
jgi:hypothetical protein